ncbi:sterile alpha motif domain-containing protein 11 isoform X7 [Marmota marmota marmota]|uniref:sterile alpha motif domain-containing protein 11 isoform X7 n=1 Tax=Marmota marmota marmota TaxID=9994 RepID=UPI002092D66B|nr:sterile alpha motif domain-containing protein 11 isoform X7 [Marmota marmota marmota]
MSLLLWTLQDKFASKACRETQWLCLPSGPAPPWARTVTFPHSYPVCTEAATSLCPSTRAAVNSREAVWRLAWDPQRLCCCQSCDPAWRLRTTTAGWFLLSVRLAASRNHSVSTTWASPAMVSAGSRAWLSTGRTRLQLLPRPSQRATGNQQNPGAPGTVRGVRLGEQKAERLEVWKPSPKELSQPPPLLSPQNAPHIALGSHFRPPFLGVPSALCQTPGYSFLPPAQAEMLARQQELLRKQNLARLEMSAELLRQKELENTHRPQLLAPEAALRAPDSTEELQRRGAMLVLKHSSAPLLALPSQSVSGPEPPTSPREPAGRAPRKGGPSSASVRPSESKETTASGLWAQDVSEEPPKDSDIREDLEIAPTGGRGSTPGQALGGTSTEGKGLLSGSTLPPPLSLGFPYSVSPYFHTGTVGGLFTDGEAATSPEDVSKWTVDDVCSFIGGLSGCGEYAPVFREQGIDGETLPLLTEEHLLTTMGLKLGPALKIRAQVAKRLGRVFYMASFPVALPLQPPTLQAPEQELTSREQPLSPPTANSPYGGSHPPSSRASPKPENGTAAVLPGAPDATQSLC